MPSQFWGYPRADGRVGTRNHVLVLAVEALSAAVAHRIGACLPRVIVMAPPTGRGQVGEDRAKSVRALAGLASSPNLAGVLLVAYDESFFQPIAAAAEQAGVGVAALAVGKHGSSLDATAAGVRKTAELLIRASALRPEPVPLSALTVSLKCGLSDSTSGLVANRVAGAVVDRLVDEGATCIFGETSELTGGEEMLVARAARADVARALVAAIESKAAMAERLGGSLAEGVLSPENRRGGLTTLEEKALGNVLKTGTRPIQGVLPYATRPPGPGVWLMDTPVFAPEAVTAMVAGGCSLVLFTTGVGNPYGDLLAPTLKIGGNPTAHRMASDHLDVDCSAVLRGGQALPDAAEALYQMVVEVASGRITRAEVLGEGGFAIARDGPSA